MTSPAMQRAVAAASRAAHAASAAADAAAALTPQTGRWQRVIDRIDRWSGRVCGRSECQQLPCLAWTVRNR